MDNAGYRELLPRLLRHCRRYFWMPSESSGLLTSAACRNNCFPRGDYCVLLPPHESHGYPSGHILFKPIPEIQHTPRIQVSLFRLLPTHPKPALIPFSFGYRLSLISLGLFYSSLTKLFLLLLLTIWLPSSTSTMPKPENPLPDWTRHLQWAHNNSNLLTHVLEILDDDKLDREWIVRNVMGGMSAGFGLRGRFNYFIIHSSQGMPLFLYLFVVILDIHPFFTTIMILIGWVAKTAVATIVSGWVGGNDSMTGEAWLAYSIP